MKVQKLLKLLMQPNTLSSSDIAVLEMLIQSYPYFYLVHALLAKAVYTEESDVEKHVVQRAATYATNRSHLRMWLENKLVWPQVAATTCNKVIPEQPAAVNGYLENIAKQAVKKGTNALSIQQFMVIDGILNKKNLQFDAIEESAHKETKMIDLSEQCTFLDDRFATETLATIMVQQKKYKRAIEIYRRLMVKNPEKKAYLSKIIAKLNHNL